MNNVKSFIPTEDGEYAVTSHSTVTFQAESNASLHQVFLFSTFPLDTGDAERWYFSMSNKQGITLTGKKNKPIYIFLVDQISSVDNTGEAVVTFTKL